MKGARIMGALALGLLVILWWALVGDADADLRRGLEESAMALDQFEAELHALDETYIPLTRQGYMLTLKNQHDRLRSGLAALKARRKALEGDSGLSPRERLPAFRALVDESDELLAQTRSLHARVKARQEFREESSPLLGTARAWRDRFAALEPDDPDLRSRRDALANSFADLEEGARIADRILATNLSQGLTLGHTNLGGLKRLVDQQESLAADLGVTAEPAAR